MSAETTQISVSISLDTRERLDRIAKARGLRKNHIVEQALRRILDELDQPTAAETLEPVHLTPSQLNRLRELLDSPPAPPTDALRAYIDGAPRLGAPNAQELTAHGHAHEDDQAPGER